MEWIDTLMMEPAQEDSPSETGPVMDFTKVVPLEGATLLWANTTTRGETAAALGLLRGFRATGRRVVLCDTSHLIVGKQFGHEVVNAGSADLLISCGISGREVGIGARDAGLGLSSVVVCGKIWAGSQVLANQLMAGDTLLLLGVDQQACEEVTSLLSNRLSLSQTMAA